MRVHPAIQMTMIIGLAIGVAFAMKLKNEGTFSAGHSSFGNIPPIAISFY